MGKAGRGPKGKSIEGSDDESSANLFDKVPKRIREDVPPQDQRELCYDSLGICGKPGCDQSLNIRTARTGVLTTVGEMAHIIAAQDNGPRGDPKFSPELRERYDNLILLCPICHPEVDNAANYVVFPASTLRDWKAVQRAQRKAAVARTREKPEVKDLAALLDELATAEPLVGDDFDRTELRKKIEVNGLSTHVESAISRNVHFIPMVSLQIELQGRINPSYGDLIDTRMAAEWLSLSGQGVGGDAAFSAMKDLLMFNRGRFGSEAIVEIVLTYFFERCTILHRH